MLQEHLTPYHDSNLPLPFFQTRTACDVPMSAAERSVACMRLSEARLATKCQGHTGEYRFAKCELCMRRRACPSTNEAHNPIRWTMITPCIQATPTRRDRRVQTLSGVANLENVGPAFRPGQPKPHFRSALRHVRDVFPSPKINMPNEFGYWAA
jgi:hypothetical protein